ncbi:hypothetical protein K1719_013325 [Acacia pycnantha]|nr:hypothetical protein K1719_013325 [Acacia pycnantha]
MRILSTLNSSDEGYAEVSGTRPIHLSFTKKAMATKFNKFQVLMLLVLLLLIITPFWPSSLKPPFLYFFVNLLIVMLGAEAGFLKAFPRPSSSTEEKKFSAASVVASIPEKKEGSTTLASGSASFSEVSEKRRLNNKIVLENFEKVKKSASMPSLLWVGEAETMVMEEEVEEEEEDDDVAGIKGQELLTKADAFIRNFYKQSKMQRD